MQPLWLTNWWPVAMPTCSTFQSLSNRSRCTLETLRLLNSILCTVLVEHTWSWLLQDCFYKCECSNVFCIYEMHTIDKYLSDMSKFEIIHVTSTNHVVQWPWFIQTNHKFNWYLGEQFGWWVCFPTQWWAIWNPIILAWKDLTPENFRPVCPASTLDLLDDLDGASRVVPLPHIMDVWYIYLHLVDYGKCT